MCGIFYYAGTPDPRLIRHGLTLAATRGPHAHGIATPDGVTRRTTILTARAAQTVCASPPPWMLAHCRLATTAPRSQDAETDVQPITRNAVILAHNGTIPDWTGKARRLHVTMRTGCDSELLAAIAAHSDLADATTLLDENPYAIILIRPDGTAQARRRRLPLHIVRTRGCTYICSRPLTADSQPIPEDTTITA